MATNTSANSPTEINTTWDINTDIYDISSSVNDVKNRYIEDIDEDTLSLGIFGFISDIESKKIQTATIMSAQLGNELFPARAKLTKNILAHAIYSNITDINAVPAMMTINIGIKESDFIDYMDQATNKFVFDSKCPIFIEDIEFHFEYDIILTRTLASSSSEERYVYSAHYDMSEKNRIANVVDPYLKQPFLIKMMNNDYIVFQTNIRQYTIEETSDKLISDSVIENKTFTFEFTNQLVDFDVYVTNEGITQRVIPILYGGEILDNPNEKYCWYFFISDNTVRITFDSSSYSPGLNSDIVVRAYTTLGADGNFEYKKYDTEEGGLYIDLESDKYNYNRIQCLAFLVTDSHWGENSKSKEELQKLIPKMAHTRAGITTEQDVLDYFNLISTETNRLIMRKKVDNQFARIWYAFFLLKDDNNNVLPTNTVDLRLTVSIDPDTPQPDGVLLSDDGKRYVVPAGTTLKLIKEEIIDPEDESVTTVWHAEIYPRDILKYYETRDEFPKKGSVHVICILKYIDELGLHETWFRWNESRQEYYTISPDDPSIILLPDPYTEAYYNEGYFYTLLHNVMVSKDPLYTAFYMTTINKDRLFTFASINEESELQYVANKISFKRSLLGDPFTYTSNFRLAQSVTTDFRVPLNDKKGETTMKVIFVLYKNNTPHRWIPAKLMDFDDVNYVTSWQLELTTDNSFDDKNDIRILDLYRIGENEESEKMDANLPAETQCDIYILAKLSDASGEFIGRVGLGYGIDDIAPGYDDWTVTNIYHIDGGFIFYDNYTNIMNAKTTPLLQQDPRYVTYNIEGIPVAGSHYMDDDTMADYFLAKVDEKKDYIKGCLSRLENNMDIDFKFFNTYGPSFTYVTDFESGDSIGHIDMSMNFKLKLKSASDIYTKDDIVAFIKNYIENLEVIGDLHIPNLITDITNEFSARIVYIEFVSYNNFPIGIQHALVKEPELDTIPEFINIRNIKNDSGFYPSINIEVVNEKTSL